MTHALAVLSAVLVLCVPTAVAAPPEGKGKPVGENRAVTCRAERGTTTQSIQAFKDKYGTNANKMNAFGKCVSGQKKDKAKEDKDEDAEDARAEENAEKKCKAERGTTAQSIQAFKDKYGTNANKANAFGKCVSKLSKQEKTSSS